MGILGESVLTLKQIDFSLRMLVIPLSIASIWLTVTNQQDSITYGAIGFNNLRSLRYTVWISAISGGYALLAAISSGVKLLVNKAWIFFVSDQVVAYLMVTSGAAMAEIIYLAYKGDATVTWSEACTTYGRFCSRLKLILGVHAIALLCFFLLAVISAYRTFSCFDPPSHPAASSSKDVEQEQMSS